MDKKFTVYKGHLYNNPKFGRITTVRETSTGKETEFLEDLTKSEAIKQFKRFNKV